MIKHTSRMYTTLLAGACALAPSIAAAEFGDATVYYEDDALLDITEWFDGNDYNPTDEFWARYDDETYDWAADVSGDLDSDWTYGYAAPAVDADWFYDYYDATPYYYDFTDDLYPYGYTYYDYDNDGTYDAYASYNDWDSDGFYEDYDYYVFNDAGTEDQQQQAMSQAPKQSKAQEVSGTVQKTKLVNTRQGRHTVVAIQPEGEQKTTIVDLGPADHLEGFNPELGDQLTAAGPVAEVGKYQVIMAQSVEANGRQMQIDRSRRQITGRVTATHTAGVRGAEHLIAMVQTQNDQTGKVAVDLGPTDNLEMTIEEGTQLTFTAVPIKAQDQRILMAQTLEHDGQQVPIQRQSQSNTSG